MICFIFGIIGVMLNIIFTQYSLFSLIGGAFFGIIIIILGKITNEAIGIGDGIVVIILGVFTGAGYNLSILFFAFLISAIISIILLTLKKLKRKDSIPFVPCLFIGYLITLALEGIY